jgi:hypothetical protein
VQRRLPVREGRSRGCINSGAFEQALDPPGVASIRAQKLQPIIGVDILASYHPECDAPPNWVMVGPIASELSSR